MIFWDRDCRIYLFQRVYFPHSHSGLYCFGIVWSGPPPARWHQTNPPLHRRLPTVWPLSWRRDHPTLCSAGGWWKMSAWQQPAWPAPGWLCHISAGLGHPGSEWAAVISPCGAFVVPLLFLPPLPNPHLNWMEGSYKNKLQHFKIM